jgi:hypothetical protein
MSGAIGVDDQSLSTRQKALDLNLDPAIYGTFAEIGGGQEVARWFFSVSGAAGGVAKTISTYDMAVSDVVQPPLQVLQTDGRHCQAAPAFHVVGGIAEQQGPFAPRALPRLIATPGPSATLSPAIPFPGALVIGQLVLRGFRRGTRRASPVARRVLAPVPSLSPRRSGPPHQPVCGGPCCLRPSIMDSASGASLFRGYRCVHFPYGPGTRRPS